MEFTLHYRGELKSNGNPIEKQKLRRHFHQQLSLVWKQPPLKNRNDLLEFPGGLEKICVIQKINGFDFAPLVTENLNLIAELKITLLRPEAPGSIITQSGDIDNRLKTLFDSLKVPKESTAIPQGDMPQESETPFFCLLEDDNLITKVSVETDRLLYPDISPSEVELLVHVKTKATVPIWKNVGLG